MLPWFSRGDAASYFGGRNIAEVRPKLEMMHVMPQMRGRLVDTFTFCNQQRKFREQFLDGAGLAIVPSDDSFRRIAAAYKEDVRAGLSQLAGDIDEKAALGCLDSKRPSGEFQHLDPVIKPRAMKFFVRIDARDNANDLVDNLRGGFG